MVLPSPPRRSLSGWLFLLCLLLLAWALRSGHLVIPDRWNPWAPLDIEATPNLLTRFKLQRASGDPEACRAALSRSGFRATSLPDAVTGPGCGFTHAFRIERMNVDVGEAFALGCPAALSLALWERHVVQPAADEHLASPVVKLEHLGSYACRNLYGEDGRRRSRHATADALDIAGFVLADGRRIRVLAHWTPADRASASFPGVVPSSNGDHPDANSRFLRALRDGACHYFDAVLGPDYNRAHADHFHFDRGAARICR